MLATGQCGWIAAAEGLLCVLCVCVLCVCVNQWMKSAGGLKVHLKKCVTTSSCLSTVVEDHVTWNAKVGLGVPK